jgi:hypothetical protein
MKPRHLTLAAATLAIAAASSQGVFAQGYNPKASAQAAQDWSRDASALAPQVPANAALDPTGPTRIASQPVPDTKENRAQFGQPLSRSGKRTAPIGD